MKTYARIENGVVFEIIKPLKYDDGSEIPIELRFPGFFLETLVDITDIVPKPDQHWIYIDGAFTPPEEG